MITEKLAVNICFGAMVAYVVITGIMWASTMHKALSPELCKSDKALLYCQEELTKKVWSF